MIQVEFTVDEVAALCGLSARTIRNWIVGGIFPNAHRRYNSAKMPYLIPAKDLLEFVGRTNPMIVPRVQKAEEAKAEEMFAAC